MIKYVATFIWGGGDFRRQEVIWIHDTTSEACQKQLLEWWDITVRQKAIGYAERTHCDIDVLIHREEHFLTMFEEARGEGDPEPGRGGP